MRTQIIQKRSVVWERWTRSPYNTFDYPKLAHLSRTKRIDLFQYLLYLIDEKVIEPIAINQLLNRYKKPRAYLALIERLKTLKT